MSHEIDGVRKEEDRLTATQPQGHADTHTDREGKDIVGMRQRLRG